MGIVRVYVRAALSSGATVTISGKQHHYLAHVLRLLPGDNVCFFNGDGNEYYCRLKTAARHDSELVCEEFRRVADTSESPLNVDLFLALAKSHSMNFALQKATELGVSGIQPILTERSQQTAYTSLKRKHRHWQEVVISAAEQCGRVVVPTVQAPLLMSDVTTPETAALLALIPGAAKSLVKELQELKTSQLQRLVLFIGPEGDFSERDKAQIMRLGFLPVHIGRRILRVETAVLTALALAQAVLGDLAHSSSGIDQ